MKGRPLRGIRDADVRRLVKPGWKSTFSWNTRARYTTVTMRVGVNSFRTFACSRTPKVHLAYRRPGTTG